MKITYKQLKQLIKEQVSSVILEQAAAAATLAPGRRASPAAGSAENPIEGPEIRISGRAPAPAPAPSRGGSTSGAGTGASGTRRYQRVIQMIDQLKGNVTPGSNNLYRTLRQIRVAASATPYDQAAVSRLTRDARRLVDDLNGQAQNIMNTLNSITSAAAATRLGGAAMADRAAAASFTDRSSATARGVGDLASSAMHAAASAPGVIPRELTIVLTPEQQQNLEGITRLLESFMRSLARIRNFLGLIQSNIADPARVLNYTPDNVWNTISQSFVGDPSANLR